MKQYQDLVRHIIENGVRKPSRTGIDTISVFGYQMRFDLSRGLPVVTTKYTHLKSVIHELIWMVCHGDTNTKYLRDNGVTIWDEWADANGDLGPVYGKQFRSWTLPEVCQECYGRKVILGNDANGSYIVDKCEACHGTGKRIIDQMQNVIDAIKKNPDGRRHIISLWNVPELKQMALEPCHAFIQFYVANGKLSCQMYQRSADVGLGVPFNIAFYAILTHMVAQLTGLGVGEFVHTFGDAHIYVNHIEALSEVLKREPMQLPLLQLNPEVANINDFTFEDFAVIDYVSHPRIKLAVAV